MKAGDAADTDSAKSTIATTDAAPSRGRTDSGADWAGAPFVFSWPTDSVIARDVVATFRSGHEAADALRAGAVHAIVGALPFRPGDAAALLAPSRLERRSGPLPVEPMRFADFGSMTIEETPPRAQHGDRISRALDVLRAEPPSVRKVVLSRALRIVADRPVDPYRLLERLITLDRAGSGFAVDLSAADSLTPSTGPVLVGSSPEVLIRRNGHRIAAHPLAGTLPRDRDPDIDRRNAESLAASAKNLSEHAFLVDHLREALEPLCASVEIPDRPTVTSTPQLWHLGTPITGVLADPAPSALEIALVLHPTPAVCGTPTDVAMDVITDLEGDRGFYAGAVGWSDSAGDGEWLVAIRCATLAADRHVIVARAGGGIVAESSVDDEVAETSAKFRTVLAALDLLD